MSRFIYNGSFKDFSGNVVSEGSITVFDAGSTVLADIYSTTGSSAITNSVVTSSTDGDFSFYVDDTVDSPTQKYKIELSKVDFTTNEYDDIQIMPPITADGTATLTNKTFAGTVGSSSATFTSPTLAGTVGSSSGTFTRPIISNFSAATHNHQSSSGGSALNGMQVQVKYTETGAVSTGDLLIPADDTVPTTAEGNVLMTLAITPTQSTNDLLIESIVNVSTTAAETVTMALFKNGDSTALAVSFTLYDNSIAGNSFRCIPLRHKLVSGATTEQTYRVHVGGSGVGITFNGTGGARLYGGKLASNIKITEIQTS